MLRFGVVAQSIDNRTRIERRDWRTPSDLRPHYFDPENASRDGLVIDVFRDNVPMWSGVFAFGETLHDAVYLLGEGSNALIIARGQGYMLDLARPKRWRSISHPFVKTSVAVPELGCAAAIDDWGICIVWAADRIGRRNFSSEAIQDVTVSGTTLEGYARFPSAPFTHFAVQVTDDNFPLA